MKIQFCGADKEVTGSCHVIELDNGFTFMMDCGLYQGHDDDMKKFNETWIRNPADIDCVVLSHAHIDHIGRLPKLVKDGFAGSIFCTPATRSLASILLADSAMIQEREAEYSNRKLQKKGIKYHSRVLEPLYVQEDVPPVLAQMASYGYDRWFKIHEDVEVKYTDAGHILGSAAINLRIKENGKTTTIAFTGDIGRPERPILRDPQPMDPAEILISESTYGDRLHGKAPQDKEGLEKIIYHTCVEKKGKLIIPAFSVGRTQEIVYMMDRMATEGRLPRIKVYVDSPLAVNATSIYMAHSECYDDEVLKYLRVDENPFGFNGLTYIKNVEDSKRLNDSDEPCVIISASGMANAGRIQHHLINNCDKSSTTILIVGYCALGTPGRLIRDGQKYITLHGQTKPINAEVEIMDSFSAHGDRNEMTAFLQNQKNSTRKIFLVHGDPDAMTSFKAHLEGEGFKNIVMPELGETVKL
ncbi:MAG: MBL fold metallo-hydrolase [Saprospiraceae bacterium]|nr:MBL fold metallo-hydrolase [Saprospiraceae bacterium]